MTVKHTMDVPRNERSNLLCFGRLYIVLPVSERDVSRDLWNTFFALNFDYSTFVIFFNIRVKMGHRQSSESTVESCCREVVDDIMAQAVQHVENENEQKANGNNKRTFEVTYCRN